MEEVGNEWTCPKCTEKKENEMNEKQNFQLKVKLKERQAFKNKKQPVKSPGAGSGPALKSPAAGAANKKESAKNTTDQAVSPDKDKKQVIYFGTFIIMKLKCGNIGNFAATEINEFLIGTISQRCFDFWE